MREAKVNDIWKSLYNIDKYDYKIKNIKLKGIVNGSFEAYKGISAICGLNGVGKSTIMLAIKDALGIYMNRFESNKIKNQKVEMEIEIKKDDKKVQVKNEEGKRLPDVLKTNSLAYYLDYGLAVKANEYLMQDNLKELLDQYEETPFSKKELEDISYLVGKQYTKCTVTEIYDENDNGYQEEEGKEINIPFFKVESQGIEYDSLTMGLGESILFYFYWFFRYISKSCIVIFEEPEAFLNIKSQQNLMNLICKKCNEVGINIIVTTHSPYIINKIREDNIYILNKFKKYTQLTNSENKHSALKNLGMYLHKKGIFYVEDEVAKWFFKILLSENDLNIETLFDIEVVNGEGNITQRLKFPKGGMFSYNMIGVYDGDMRGAIKDKEINWNYIFLPEDKSVEARFKEIVNEKTDEFIRKFNKDQTKIIEILQNHDGEECHDWFNNIAKDLHYNVENFIRIFYELWIQEEGSIELSKQFICQLKNILKNI